MYKYLRLVLKNSTWENVLCYIPLLINCATNAGSFTASQPCLVLPCFVVFQISKPSLVYWSVCCGRALLKPDVISSPRFNRAWEHVVPSFTPGCDPWSPKDSQRRPFECLPLYNKWHGAHGIFLTQGETKAVFFGSFYCFHFVIVALQCCKQLDLKQAC